MYRTLTHIKLITIVLAAVLFVTGIYAQGGRGRELAFGTVRDETGAIVEGVKIRAEFFGNITNELELTLKEEMATQMVEGAKVRPTYSGKTEAESLDESGSIQPSYVVETMTNKKGGWSIMGLSKGSWRITAVYNGYAFNSMFMVRRLGKIDFTVNREALSKFLEAKQLIYKKEWRRVHEMLEVLPLKDSHAALSAEIMYWRSYCLHQLSTGAKTSERVNTRLRKAVTGLDHLVKDYPMSEWVDDSRILKLELLYHLVKAGEKQHLEAIRKAAKGGKNIPMDVCLAALDILVREEPETALPTLEQIVFKNKFPRNRQKALLSLSRYRHQKTREILETIAREDPDPSVKNRAALLLRQLQ